MFSSIEIYVYALLLAVGVVALCVRPSRHGHARQYLLEGVLCRFEAEGSPRPGESGVKLACQANGDVLLTRYGIEGLRQGGALSLAVTVADFDVTIEERCVMSADGEPVDTALFTLEFLGKERYHIRYSSEWTSTAVAFTLSNREGMELDKRLRVDS
ncbi:MAG: hypothetical protein NC111_04910 [Bacteroides sp.]|nr:hypothetical protein [Bacteroides sp.]MCM1413667.1 hypothetical protein [Bacteroides sp.]MCM1471846.1 hypothetical protein [Bacteroides sp.]